MAVAIAGDRKGVEITWDPSGGAAPPEVNVPEFPTHPIVGDPSGPRPDHELPGDQPKPEHPIFLPPYIDNSLPGGGGEGIWGPTDPRPTPPIELPDIGLDEEQKEKLKEFLEGNLPPFDPPDYVAPVNATAAVQVFGQGQDGDWSNTAVMPNDGRCSLSYPVGFTGESYVEVRALDGTLVDSGTITVG